MKKYIAYFVIYLVLVGMFSACTAEELDPQSSIDNTKGASYIGIEPIQPSIPKP